MGVLLVSAEKIKAFTNINDNVDEALLLSNIQVATDLGLQNLLGTKFTNHILNAAQTNTLTGPETILVQQYIQPYLIHRAYWEALPQIWMRVMNKTIVIGNTEQGTGVSSKDMIYMRQTAEDRFQFYAQRLMDYIINNPNGFPDYFAYSSTDGMPPARENYFSGFHVSNAQPRKLAPVSPYRYDFTSIYYGC